MRHRQFVVLLGGAALWPAEVAAQPSGIARVGFLISNAAPEPISTYFRQGLRDVGWVEGKNLRLEIRSSADPNVLAAVAAEFVRQKVNVIATVADEATGMRRSRRVTIWTPGPILRGAPSAPSTLAASGALAP